MNKRLNRFQEENAKLREEIRHLKGALVEVNFSRKTLVRKDLLFGKENREKSSGFELPKFAICSKENEENRVFQGSFGVLPGSEVVSHELSLVHRNNEEKQGKKDVIEEPVLPSWLGNEKSQTFSRPLNLEKVDFTELETSISKLDTFTSSNFEEQNDLKNSSRLVLKISKLKQENEKLRNKLKVAPKSQNRKSAKKKSSRSSGLNSTLPKPRSCSFMKKTIFTAS